MSEVDQASKFARDPDRLGNQRLDAEYPSDFVPGDAMRAISGSPALSAPMSRRNRHEGVVTDMHSLEGPKARFKRSPRGGKSTVQQVGTGPVVLVGGLRVHTGIQVVVHLGRSQDEESCRSGRVLGVAGRIDLWHGSQKL